jgi:hypothetical protein
VKFDVPPVAYNSRYCPFKRRVAFAESRNSVPEYPYVVLSVTV